MSQGPTRRWQFSLLTLLLAMGGVAIACLALRTPNDLWASLMFLAVLASLALAALTAIYRDGRTRAFALGFLVVAAGFWGLVLLTERDENYGQPRLPTTRWAIALYSLLHKDSMQTATVMTAVYSAPVAYGGPPPPAVSYTVAVPPTAAPVPAVAYVPQQIQQPQFLMQTFLEISQQSLALLLGLLGGIVAQWLYATRREEPRPQPAS